MLKCPFRMRRRMSVARPFRGSRSEAPAFDPSCGQAADHHLLLGCQWEISERRLEDRRPAPDGKGLSANDAVGDFVFHYHILPNAGPVGSGDNLRYRERQAGEPVRANEMRTRMIGTQIRDAGHVPEDRFLVACQFPVTHTIVQVLRIQLPRAEPGRI